MTKTRQKFKDSPSWVKHLITALASITVAWIGAWQTAAAQTPNTYNSYPIDKLAIRQTLNQHTAQLARISTVLTQVQIDTSRNSTLLQTLVNGGTLHGK